MKITTLPYTFASGLLLDPNCVDDNLSYLASASADVFQKRYARSVVVYPFQADVAAGYTDGYSQELRSYRITATEQLVIEHCYLDGATVSGSADIYIYDVATGLAPAGVTNPILSANTTEATDTFSQQIVIPAGSTFRFEIFNASSFTVSKLDLVVHYRSDRFNQTGSDSFTTLRPTLFTEASTLDGPGVAAAYTAVSTAVNANVAKVNARKVMFFVAHNFTSGTDTDTLRFTLPITNSLKGRCKVVGMHCFAKFASNGGVSDAITFRVGNAVNSFVNSQTVSMNGISFGSASDATSYQLDSASTAIESDSSMDYRVVISNATGTSCQKAYCYLFIE